MKKILQHLKDYWIQYGFETLVVTMGILGAFALNNWNESRNDSQKEQFYVKALQMEFEDNLQELKGDIEGRMRIIHSLRALKDAKRINKVDTSKRNVLEAVRFYVPTSATYEDLITTGQIKLLKSDSLRYWLMAYNQEVKRNEKLEQADFQFVNSYVIPFQVRNANYMQNESLSYELTAICDRRITSNEGILFFNQRLLTIIEKVKRHLQME